MKFIKKSKNKMKLMRTEDRWIKFKKGSGKERENEKENDGKKGKWIKINSKRRKTFEIKMFRLT